MARIFIEDAGSANINRNFCTLCCKEIKGEPPAEVRLEAPYIGNRVYHSKNICNECAAAIDTVINSRKKKLSIKVDVEVIDG